ncbi:MAG: BatA domain-containing protein [Saprospiraceae bacterium]|jgi:hypothetical protein|uniref:BatA domain-containing protein n=1 Tax=Candidatus Brachybacter algidus TaxID=2982024 RepID=UPI001B55AA26|nr:BatA domain-containing protein [Candidatus Brachybacter algidus]MBP7305465.1 BatA domain-containing protein [Saprospiraceae bacterium]MBK6448478.1 BatA domain-containing protein [Candidatus Brachybacter algidus]MBK7603971.1 BatA domain-containing protein [Candidatus Brachybacter algidus]MBK8841721.1 BatA domain-containing protein [Candidatus Brachybacter algidus]MBP7540182.1 BatA domain-containing protein [Saprospiraceae bacterium]
MQFLFPAFLTAAFVIAIPIIIHLFNFRRYKKVFFTNVAFLRSIQQTSNSRKKVQQWLVLACRCLALIALVMAFAQPFFETKGKVKQGTNYSFIYLDNSFSMGASTSEDNLLEKAKETAHQIVSGFGADDKFQIITNNLEGGQQQWLNKEEANAVIDEKVISPQFKTFSQIFKTIQQNFKISGQGKYNAFFLSDFQVNAADLAKLKDTSIQCSLVPLTTSNISNSYIDSAYFKDQVSSPGIANQLIYKIKNDGDKVTTIKPVLKFNGNNRPLAIHKLAARSSITDTVPVLTTQSGYQTAELLINDAPITFDDNYFIAWNEISKVNVLIINDGVSNKYLNTALETSKLFNVTNEELSRVNFGRFNDYQLIILNEINSTTSGLTGELTKAMDAGTNVAIFPSIRNGQVIAQLSSAFNLGASGTVVSSNKQVFTINSKDYIFQNVFEGKTQQLKLPVTKAGFNIQTKATKGAISLLTYRDGSAFLVRYPRFSGQVFLCASPLDVDYSDFVKNGEVIVPFLFKAAFNNSSQQKLSFTIGKNESFEINVEAASSDGVLKFNGTQTFIPEQIKKGKKTIINTGRETILPGIYQLEKSGKFAFNYDRKESQMEFMSLEKIKSYENDNLKVITPSAQANLASVVQEGDTGLSLWKYFLLTALLFLLLEILLIRFYK